MSHEQEVYEEEDEVAPWDLLAGALGSLHEIDEPDEDPVLNVMEGATEFADVDPLTKVPLEKASNLLKLRRLCREVESGSLSKEDFLNGIRPMYRSLDNGLQLVGSEAAQKQLLELDEAERAVFDATHRTIGVMWEGLAMMLSYKESNALDHVRQGMQMIEDGFAELDQIQDQAIEMAREEYEEEYVEEYEEE